MLTTQHPYNKVGLWPQNLTKSMLKSIKMQKDERLYMRSQSCYADQAEDSQVATPTFACFAGGFSHPLLTPTIAV